MNQDRIHFVPAEIRMHVIAALLPCQSTNSFEGHFRRLLAQALLVAAARTALATHPPYLAHWRSHAPPERGLGLNGSRELNGREPPFSSHPNSFNPLLSTQ
jgi:hypothetical protein